MHYELCFVVKIYFLISLGDGSSWIVGKVCTDPDGDEPYIFHRYYTEEPVKDVEAAKKECADACDANEKCKYADLRWEVESTAKWCTFWTKDVCKMVDNEYMDTYVYTKQ